MNYHDEGYELRQALGLGTLVASCRLVSIDFSLKKFCPEVNVGPPVL